MASTTGTDKILELVCRLGGLGFSAVYTHTHGSERASALRVAELGYRFLKGESADSLNSAADAANATREKEENAGTHMWLPIPTIPKRRNHG